MDDSPPTSHISHGAYKIPISVLVVIYTPLGQVLLLERRRHPGFWQSVTGSIDYLEEPLRTTAIREVWEETGIPAEGQGRQLSDWGKNQSYQIYERWRDRYAPGITHNTEHVWGLQIKECIIPILSREHSAYQWLDWRKAVTLCFSPTNQEAILSLEKRLDKT